MALEAFPTHDLLVLTDSRPALRIVRQAMNARGMNPSCFHQALKSTPSRLHAPLWRAVAGYGGHVNFRWVPGHAGQELNEAADRLVRAVRREAEGAAAPGSAKQVRHNIRDEMCQG